jgi:catechol 2,3-dioxygenase-like lactoylglutathione lyase family enzyme
MAGMIGKLRSVVIDCPDPRALAGFYSELLGLPVTYDEDEWMVIGGGPGQPRVAFQLAPDLREPRWPDPERPQQFHLDVDVDEINTAEEKALALGARRLWARGEVDGTPGEGRDFRVYADPAGHPFCLCFDVE